jgi:hypothetical protein
MVTVQSVLSTLPLGFLPEPVGPIDLERLIRKNDSEAPLE